MSRTHVTDWNMSAWKLITMAFLSASCASSCRARDLLTPQLSQPAPLYVRYCYEGGTLNRDGRLLPIEVSMVLLFVAMIFSRA